MRFRLIDGLTPCRVFVRCSLFFSLSRLVFNNKFVRFHFEKRILNDDDDFVGCGIDDVYAFAPATGDHMVIFRMHCLHKKTPHGTYTPFVYYEHYDSVVGFLSSCLSMK